MRFRDRCHPNGCLRRDHWDLILPVVSALFSSALSLVEVLVSARWRFVKVGSGGVSSFVRYSRSIPTSGWILEPDEFLAEGLVLRVAEVV